jgi:hypothetical protein
MVAAELGITLIPQSAVDSELASTRNVVIRPLSPDKPFRTLVLAWRPTTSHGAEFRMLGNLIRGCLTGTKSAIAPDRDTEALPARQAAHHAAIHCGDACQERRSVFIEPARLIGIILFCADASAIGCSDYCVRNFPLAIRSRATT